MLEQHESASSSTSASESTLGKYTRSMITLTLLNDRGVIKRGHFVGTSGEHLDTYINKKKLFEDEKIGAGIGELFADVADGIDVEVVVGPATGGNKLSFWTMDALYEKNKKPIERVVTIKNEAQQIALTEREAERLRGKRVMVVDDITTTGKSLKETIRLVRDAGGEVVLSSVMVNRSPKTVHTRSVGVPFQALIDFKLKSWKPEKIPQRLQKIPISTEYGHGKKTVLSR